MAIPKLRTLEGRLLVHREACRRISAEIRREQEAFVFATIAKDADRLWTAKAVADVIATEVQIEPGELQLMLDQGVRQNRLRRIGYGYQLIRPGVLDTLVRGNVA